MGVRKETWVAPTTVAEGEQRRETLVIEVKEIEAQLGNRDRTDETGRRLSGEEYWTWRQRAQYSVTQKQKELILLRGWLKQHRTDNTNHDRLIDGCVLCGAEWPGMGAIDQGWLALRGRHPMTGWYQVTQCPACSAAVTENVDAHLMAQERGDASTGTR